MKTANAITENAVYCRCPKLFEKPSGYVEILGARVVIYSSVLTTRSSGVTFEPYCYLVLSVRCM